MNIHLRERPTEPLPRRFDIRDLDRMIKAGIIGPDETLAPAHPLLADIAIRLGAIA